MTTFADWPMAKVAAPETDHSDHVMIALRPPLDLRDTFASMRVCTEDVDELHLTLLYLGTTEDAGGEMGRERLYRACYGAAMGYERAVLGKCNGFGWFLNDDAHVLVSLWDVPYLSEFREQVVDQCIVHGVPLREDNHGFTPHMTLAYEDPDKEARRTIPQVPVGGRAEVDFGSIWLVWGEDWQEIPLT